MFGASSELASVMEFGFKRAGLSQNMNGLFIAPVVAIIPRQILSSCAYVLWRHASVTDSFSDATNAVPISTEIYVVHCKLVSQKDQPVTTAQQ